MSTREAPEAAAALRANAMEGGMVRIQSRGHHYFAEGQTMQRADASHPTALDYLLGALASDLIAGLEREARRAGATLGAVEASLTAWLENPLVPLGVIGEEGSSRVARVRGSVYVSGDLEEETLRELWAEALRKAPVYTTLSETVQVDVSIQCIL
jgi:uncharacterized OsmC-like protein